MKGTIWTVAIVVMLAGVVLIGVDMQYQGAGSDVGVEGEEHTLSPNDETTLEASGHWSFMYQNETVTDDQDTELERGEDYEIDYESGTLIGLGTTDVDVQIAYAFVEHDEDTRTIAALIGIPVTVIPWLILLAVGGVLVAWIGLMPGGGR